MIASPTVSPAPGAYAAHGKLSDAFADKSPEVLVSGPAGTGKSRAFLEKIYACLHKYPGCRWLIARKTRESLTESGLVTWEDHVVPRGHPMLSGPQREQRHVYRVGKSELVVGGLDRMSKTLSTEYDGVYVQEATELVEPEWEVLIRSLRHGAMPYQQIVGDCNPDVPTHWLLQRAKTGKLALYESRHEDNPKLYHEDGSLTLFGASYIGKLDRLTGVRYQRLRLGKWVSAEGVVYEAWNPAVHVLPRRAITGDAAHPIPKEWPRIVTIDFGYVNPFVAQWWARDPDGRLILYREVYRSKVLVRAHAYAIAEGCAEDGVLPAAIITDHDAEGRATLERWLPKALRQNGFKVRYADTIPADKRIKEGIQAVTERLLPGEDGHPRLYVLAGSLVERDEWLVDQKLPASTEEEFVGYVWPKDVHGRVVKETPVDADNHGMDALRYSVAAYDLNGGAQVRRTSFGG